MGNRYENVAGAQYLAQGIPLAMGSLTRSGGWDAAHVWLPAEQARQWLPAHGWTTRVDGLEQLHAAVAGAVVGPIRGVAAIAAHLGLMRIADLSGMAHESWNVAARDAGIACAAAVPVIRDDKLIAVIEAYNTTSAKPTEDAVAALYDAADALAALPIAAAPRKSVTPREGTHDQLDDETVDVSPEVRQSVSRIIRDAMPQSA